MFSLLLLPWPAYGATWARMPSLTWSLSIGYSDTVPQWSEYEAIGRIVLAHTVLSFNLSPPSRQPPASRYQEIQSNGQVMLDHFSVLSIIVTRENHTDGSRQKGQWLNFYLKQDTTKQKKGKKRKNGKNRAGERVLLHVRFSQRWARCRFHGYRISKHKKLNLSVEPKSLSRCHHTKFFFLKNKVFAQQSVR